MARDEASPMPELRLVNSPPSAKGRRWLSLVFLLFLLSQIAIPASYYLRGEPTSELFAWRMFSTVHMTKWHCQITETLEQDGQRVERLVPLEGAVQESTVNCLHAGQLDFVEAFLRRWLEREGVVRVEYVTQGVLPDGQFTDPIRLVATRGVPGVQRF